jgi:hypothetical protein
MVYCSIVLLKDIQLYYFNTKNGTRPMVEHDNMNETFVICNDSHAIIDKNVIHCAYVDNNLFNVHKIVE